jgi:SAM-dependent methyltransferase
VGVALRDEWRANAFSAVFGQPSGPIGWVGARVLPFVVRRLYEVMADTLDLQPDDDLLDVGCGSAVFLDDQAAHVRYVAGLDASHIQVGLARRRLRQRIAAGTAQVVLGDATALPWPDGRFSAVTSLNCLKFVPDPDRALREMCRVVRPGGRVALGSGPSPRDPDKSGTIDALGMWQWSAADSQRKMVEAGFTQVSVRQLSAKYLRLQLVLGMKPE